MYIYATGVAPTEFRTSLNYLTDTTYGLEWFKGADGNYYASDLGPEADTYIASIKTYGTESYINNLITTLDSIRTNHTVLLMSDFASNELFFGEDVNHSGVVSGVVSDIELRKSVSLRGFELNAKIRGIDLAFNTYASGWPATIDCVQQDYEADRDYTVGIYDTYTSEPYAYDELSDEGICTFAATLTNAQLAQLRYYKRVHRGGDITLPLNGLAGISYPFGPSSGAGPHTIKFLDIKEKSRLGLTHWVVNLKLSEVIS